MLPVIVNVSVKNNAKKELLQLRLSERSHRGVTVVQKIESVSRNPPFKRHVVSVALAACEVTTYREDSFCKCLR